MKSPFEVSAKRKKGEGSGEMMHNNFLCILLFSIGLSNTQALFGKTKTKSDAALLPRLFPHSDKSYLVEFHSDGAEHRDDMEPVLERMEIQLRKSGVKTLNTKKANLSWALTDIKNLTNRFFKGNYILIFPFCSKKHIKKKWPYYREFIDELISMN